MTPEEQRIAIAEWCGWRVVHAKDSPATFPEPHIRSKEDRLNIERSDRWHLLHGDRLIESFKWNTFNGKIPNPTLSCYPSPLPDYLNDLNAMHDLEALVIQNADLGYAYDMALMEVTGAHDGDAGLVKFMCLWHATAAQRAEALLRTIGKWKD